MVASRYAGVVMEQPGDFVDGLPAGRHEGKSGQVVKNAVSWVSTVAGIQDEFWL